MHRPEGRQNRTLQPIGLCQKSHSREDRAVVIRHGAEIVGRYANSPGLRVEEFWQVPPPGNGVQV